MSAYDVLAAALTAVLGARTGLGLVAAIVHRTRRRPRPDFSPRVSVLIPAHNEESVIASTIRSVASSAHPELEIVVVDDGSSDRTLAVALEAAADLPRVRVIGQSPNQGKAAALNRAMAEAQADVLVTVDADTQVEADSIARMASWFVDPNVAAVCGNVKVGNRQGWFGIAQSIEYVAALNIERRAQATLGCITTVPGAMGAFRRGAVEAVGGFPGDTLTEDTDLTIALLRAGYGIRYEDQAVAWTEAPATLGGLFRQRTRWLRGNLQCAWKHRSGLVRGPWRVRVMALPNLWFAQVGVYVVPLFLATWSAACSWTLFGRLSLSFLAFELALIALAYVFDGERMSELWLAPSQRLLWPVGSWAVFATVVLKIVAGSAPQWARVERRGSLALGMRRVAREGISTERIPTQAPPESIVPTDMGLDFGEEV